MTEFERALQQGLRRTAAPPSLMAFLENATQQPAPQQSARRRWSLALPEWLKGWQLWTAVPLAAALVVGAFLAEDIHQRHQREQAQQQFDAAMRITDHALDHAQQQLAKAGINFAD